MVRVEGEAQGGWKGDVLASYGPEFGEVQCARVRGIQEGVVMDSGCVFRRFRAVSGLVSAVG